MQYIKTLKKFVAGSDKYFDVFKCTVEEVEEYRDSAGRRQIKVKIGDKEYKGMHNKKVFEFIVENEGSESFVVFWKHPKGNYMISYAWELWQAVIDGDAKWDTTREPEADPKTNREAFVYLWIDRKGDRKYIGVHKGTADDGYVCSSEPMLQEFNARPDDFVRTILAYGDRQSMLELETILLIQLGAANGEDWYNLQNNLRK